MPAFIDITGQRFGRLVAIHRVPAPAHIIHKRPHFLCRCDCGQDTIVTSGQLKNGNTTSCGCYDRERRVKHGGAVRGKRRDKTYQAWKNMRQRCRDTREKTFYSYGGRGISVCERWNNFASFLADMGEAPPGLTLDRINNDLGYSPENCRWATYKEQNHNQRPKRLKMPAI